MRLQDVYGLSVKGMANGVFQPAGTGRPPLYSPGRRVALSADDCFHVGKVRASAAARCPRRGATWRFWVFFPPPLPTWRRRGPSESARRHPAAPAQLVGFLLPRGSGKGKGELMARPGAPVRHGAGTGLGAAGRVSSSPSGGESGSPGGILGAVREAETFSGQSPLRGQD